MTQLSINALLDQADARKPVIYVLYGEKSGLVKVGQTMNLVNRVRHYEDGKGYGNNRFRKDETIYLVGACSLPTNYRYQSKRETKFIDRCERDALKCAATIFGESIYGTEWFDASNKDNLTNFLDTIDDVVANEIKNFVGSSAMHYVEKDGYMVHVSDL